MTERAGVGGAKPNARYAELDDEAIVWMFETYGSFVGPVMSEAAELFVTQYRPDYRTLDASKAEAAYTNTRKRIKRRLEEIQASII